MHEKLIQRLRDTSITEYKANCCFIAGRDSMQLKNCMCCQEPFDFKDNPVWMDTNDDPLNKCTIYICKKCKSVYIYYWVEENQS